MASAAAIYPPLEQRPFKNTVLLFDVDDTLTKPRQVRSNAFHFMSCSKMHFKFEHQLHHGT